MKNSKGQALVEFILILPVFLMILFLVIDFGRFWYLKNNLENVSTDVVLMLRNGDTMDDVSNRYKDISVSKSTYEEDYYKIVISQDMEVFTPFLSNLVDSIFKLETERIIPKNE